MAEDRFANVMNTRLVLSAANTVTFTQMNFGMTLRDRIALVIDELYLFVSSAMILEMTTAGDFFLGALTLSDQLTSFAVDDTRVIFMMQQSRMDWGTAAGGQLVRIPMKESFSPPIIVLPTRLFFGGQTGGLASAATLDLRMHYRTIPITQDRQIVEILETLQLQ